MLANDCSFSRRINDGIQTDTQVLFDFDDMTVPRCLCLCSRQCAVLTWSCSQFPPSMLELFKQTIPFEWILFSSQRHTRSVISFTISWVYICAIDWHKTICDWHFYFPLIFLHATCRRRCGVDHVAIACVSLSRRDNRMWLHRTVSNRYIWFGATNSRAKKKNNRTKWMSVVNDWNSTKMLNEFYWFLLLKVHIIHIIKISLCSTGSVEILITEYKDLTHYFGYAIVAKATYFARNNYRVSLKLNEFNELNECEARA